MCLCLEQNFDCVLSAAGSDWSWARGQENNVALNSDLIRSGGPACASELCVLVCSLCCVRQMSDKLQRLRCGGAAIVPSLFLFLRNVFSAHVPTHPSESAAPRRAAEITAKRRGAQDGRGMLSRCESDH